MSAESLVYPSAEELRALRAIFSVYDQTGSGSIATTYIPDILEKLERDASEEFLNELDEYTSASGTLRFEDFVSLIRNEERRRREQEQMQRTGVRDQTGLLEPKIMEFIGILEDYRLKCEDEGKYLEAQRADSQLAALCQHEFKRQSKALKARQMAERHDVQIAHDVQLKEFHNAWEQYLEEYDRMAQVYVNQMREKHLVDRTAFLDKFQQEMAERQPKFSRDLIEWRCRQRRLAQQKNYAEAHEMKRVADELEADERSKLDEDFRDVMARKEAKLCQQQHAELTALTKRIDCRRHEHLKQRTIDTERLVQRHRNVQSVLESKQITEATRTIQHIRMSLMPMERSTRRGPFNVIPVQARVIRPKKPHTAKPADLLLVNSNTQRNSRNPIH